MESREENRGRENSRDREREFSFEIVEHLGIIGRGTKGWTKELNIVKYNESHPKYDIRDWKEDHEKMSRGVTLNAAEIRELGKIIADLPGLECESDSLAHSGAEHGQELALANG